jgi:anti-anti-sigma factor
MTNLAPAATGTLKDGALVVTVVPQQLREAATAYSLRDEIIALVDSSQTRALVIDAGNLQFIGSIGFLAFLGVRRHLGDGRIILCNLAPPVQEIFAICGLISIDGTKAVPFEVAATVEAAVARLARS